MALYSHEDRTIPYETTKAPFAHDLILLQSSSFPASFWEPVIEDFAEDESSGGRLMISEWFEKGVRPEDLARDFAGLVQTVGLQLIHVVACGDAVELVSRLEMQQPGIFAKTLLFPNGGPPPAELARAIREFSQI